MPERYTKEERRRMRAVKRLANERESEWEGFITHSAMYHRVFEGYSERQVPRKSGKGVRIERVYAGNYYVRRGGAAALRRAKVLYGILYLAAVVCAGFAFTRPTGYNSVWYGVIPMFLLIVAMLIFAANLFSCLAAPERMQAYHFNCFGRLITASLLSGVIAAVYALISPAFGFLTGRWEGIPASGLFGLLAAAAFFALFALERRAGYETIEADTAIANDAVVIS